MYRARLRTQEWTLAFVPAQAKMVLRGINVFALKFIGTHAEKRSQTRNVCDAQIDPTSLRAAACASGLAGKTHAELAIEILPGFSALNK
jgi:hypothetical protein